MPEITDHGPPPEEQESRPQSREDGLFQSLKRAHELDHEILDALGIKHPHIPILSVVEMLGHLRDKHADESHKGELGEP